MKNKNETVRLHGALSVNTALGNLDEAMKALEREAVTHSWPFLTDSMPFFSELRKDPRYPAFRRAVGLAKGD